MEPTIVQWNANGLGQRVKLGELERLLSKHNPICLCVQHVGTEDINIKNYKLAVQSSNANGELGTAIYVRDNATYDNLPINNTNFQPTAITLHLPGATKLNILNVYNQPAFKYRMEELKVLVKTINHPKLVLGDLNSHSPIWDEKYYESDRGGKKIEQLMEEDDLECLNEPEVTTS